MDSNSSSSDAPKPREGSNISSSIISALTGAGRGKPLQTASTVSEKPKEENRHIRPRQQKAADSQERASSPPPQRLSRDDAVKKAVGEEEEEEEESIFVVMRRMIVWRVGFILVMMLMGRN